MCVCVCGGGGGGSETRVTATVLKQDPNTTRFKSDQPVVAPPNIACWVGKGVWEGGGGGSETRQG